MAMSGTGEANMISAAFPYQKQRRRVLGREMAYVEVGQGDPIVLLHGNPPSSYLWRNVLPHLQPLGRCIAPDLIGMGDSDKLPNSGPGSYRFVEHRRYLDALLEALDMHERVTFVIHDWGSALGFDWANRHREAVKGIAFMEAIVRPQSWDHWDKINMRPALQALRSEAGEEMVLRDNFTSADRGEGRGAPLRPGRFAGRDRAGHRRLDVEVIERTYLEIPGLRTVADVPRIGCQRGAYAQVTQGGPDK